ncbi:MAG TPA: LPS export ABC transporter periplasmic protein LptC [Lacunisphaera sp.]
MFFPRQRFPFLLCPLAAAVVALAATSQISPGKPVINFRLPSFTPEGYRSLLVRGSEAQYLPQNNEVDVKGLTLSVFSGKSDDKLTTMMLSPAAKVLPDKSLVVSDSTIRVINDDFEATGTGWSYDHKERKIIIDKKVRVTLHGEIENFLK